MGQNAARGPSCLGAYAIHHGIFTTSLTKGCRVWSSSFEYYVEMHDHIRLSNAHAGTEL